MRKLQSIIAKEVRNFEIWGVSGSNSNNNNNNKNDNSNNNSVT